MRDKDTNQVADIYLKCFKGMSRPSEVRKWLRLRHASYPIGQFFVGALGSKIVGYILWIELGGFRKEAVLELDQIAVSPEYQGRGFGKTIIKESLKHISSYLKKRTSALKLVKVTTGTTNEAQKLYKDVLHAEPVAIIPDFFRADEVIMIARSSDLVNLL
ncbi:MAG: ribosomal protein S18 acetylase RimI-like enzyme [Candidatus Nitrosomirales archaeon]|jgi:ribosomal protein S18 acetylase RimI-like enzyme